MNIPKTREEALEKGLKHYYSGIPCRNGHIDKRFSRCNHCLSCVREAQLRFYRTPSGRAYHRAKTASHQPRKSKLIRHNLSEIESFYLNCPPGHAVDHILPRHGRIVSGLHHLSNLQYLPSEENMRKNNKVDPATLDAVICVLPPYRSYIKG